MSTHDLAWAAGFFDGEGNIRGTVRERLDGSLGSPRIILQLPQKDRERLDKFASIFNLKVLGPYDNAGRVIHQISVGNFEQVQAIVAKMWKWLGLVKRQQAKVALQRYLSVVQKD